MEHRTLPPSLHFTEPNPEIDFGATPFFVNAALREWRPEGTPLRAGVSSFGIGGTNAHVVLQEAPQPAPSGPALRKQLVVLSARTPTALVETTRRLAVHLEQHPDTALPDLAYTLQLGRQPLTDRRFTVCSDTADLREVLDDTLTRAAKAHELGRMVHARQRARDRDLVFMFPGQGAQRLAMGQGLYAQLDEFRRHVDECAEIAAEPLGRDLREVLFSATADAGADLHETRISQPALFTVEYALARLLMSWGMTPTALLGHSLGEYVAACLSGVFTLPAALRLVVDRGRLIQSLPRGAMLAVGLPEAELRAMLPGDVEIAVVNGADRCVVSGPAEPGDRLAVRLDGAGVSVRRLQVSHALHSAMMEPILPEFEESVRRAGPRPPTTPYVSNVTGTWVTAEQATDPGHWRRHLRDTVRFADCLTTVLVEADRVLVEVGPGRTLTTLARQHAASPLSSRVVTTMVAPKEHDGDELAAVLTGVGNLWALGTAVDWAKLHRPHRRQRVPLPTYPFERQHLLLDPAELLRAVRSSGGLPVTETVPEPSAEPPAAAPSVPTAPASGDELYEQVSAILADVLGAEELRPDDDFFALGGDSLTATLVTSRVRDELNIDAPLETIFDYTTLAEFVRELAAVAALGAQNGAGGR
jgi:phthiocerol/phenolphthiocerol synthesis type-I polyketide synthase E